MRRLAFVVLVSHITLTGCSDPECLRDEVRIGDVCRPLARRDAGEPEAVEGERADAAVVHDATLPDGPVVVDAGDASDARQAPDTSAPATASEGEGEADAAVDASPGEPDATGDEPDASAPMDAAIVDAAPACQATAEVCDGKDNDCDGVIDEDPPTWYPDCDLDGAPSVENGITACTKPTPADCPTWTDQKPAVSDCNDRDRRYAPNVPVYTGGNGANPLEAESYSGDMDCDGVVERAPGWEYWSDADARWLPSSPGDAALSLCPAGETSCSPTLGASCYINKTRPGQPLGCGNSEIEIAGTFDNCFGAFYTVRVICR